MIAKTKTPFTHECSPAIWDLGTVPVIGNSSALLCLGAQCLPRDGLIPITRFGDGSHRLFPGTAAKFPQLVVYLPIRKANETHWHAIGRFKAASLLSPWHPRKAGRQGTCLLADATIN
jgi:hypothetical protein